MFWSDHVSLTQEIHRWSASKHVETLTNDGISSIQTMSTGGEKCCHKCKDSFEVMRRASYTSKQWYNGLCDTFSEYNGSTNFLRGLYCSTRSGAPEMLRGVPTTVAQSSQLRKELPSNKRMHLLSWSFTGRPKLYELYTIRHANPLFRRRQHTSISP